MPKHTYNHTYDQPIFEWDHQKEAKNIAKHGISFQQARSAFADPDRLIVPDDRHSHLEKRYLCIARVNDGIITVRFTIRGHCIRIIGAGNWRKQRKYYQERNPHA